MSEQPSPASRTVTFIATPADILALINVGLAAGSRRPLRDFSTAIRFAIHDTARRHLRTVAATDTETADTETANA